MDDASRPSRDGRVPSSELLPLVLVAITWIAVLAFVAPGDVVLRGDAQRFAEIAASGQIPYRIMPVEFPPLETQLILILARASVLGIMLRLAVINGAATLAVWWVLRRYWNRNVATLFLWLALPMQYFLPFRIDMLSVTMIVASLVVVERGRSSAGGLVASISILFRVWPVVVLPAFLLRRQLRAFVVAGVATVILVAVWLAVSGVGAIHQVSDYRGATGWHVETAAALITQMFHPGEAFRFEEGALRVGRMLGWEVAALRLTTLILVACAWWLGWRRGVEPTGAPALAAVSVLALLSPVFSAQYVAWLLPWAAILATERKGRDVFICAFGASLFALLSILVYVAFRNQAVMDAFTAGKLICIVGLAVIGFTHGRRATLDDPPGAAADLETYADA